MAETERNDKIKDNKNNKNIIKNKNTLINFFIKLKKYILIMNSFFRYSEYCLSIWEMRGIV
jgi:hypothetical protein